MPWPSPRWRTIRDILTARTGLLRFISFLLRCSKWQLAWFWRGEVLNGCHPLTIHPERTHQHRYIQPCSSSIPHTSAVSAATLTTAEGEDQAASVAVREVRVPAFCPVIYAACTARSGLRYTPMRHPRCRLPESGAHIDQRVASLSDVDKFKHRC